MKKKKKKSITMSSHPIPAKKIIKSKKDKEKAECLAMYYKVSIREAYDYLKILDKKTINQIIRNYENKSSRKTIQSIKK